MTNDSHSQRTAGAKKAGVKKPALNDSLIGSVTTALDDTAARDEWVPRTKSGVIGAVQLLAVILWALSPERPSKEADSQIVGSWAARLLDATRMRCAVLGLHGPHRAVTPFDPLTFLELREPSKDWLWTLTVDNADSFLTDCHMGFNCSDVLAYWRGEDSPYARSSYGDSFTQDERTHAVNKLREWFNLDTWTVREGLLLLVGIDPHRSDCWKLTEQGFETETQPAWARITARPGLSFDDVDANGMPRITGYVLDLTQAEQLSKLLSLWASKPGHALQDRRAPRYYIEWATSKGHPPFWKPWVFDAGLVLELPPTALFEPEVASAIEMDSGTDKDRRQDGRLALLRKLDGNVVRKRGELRVYGITALMKRETAAGARASSEKTIRADVKAAYERENAPGRRGHFSGLGSR